LREGLSSFDLAVLTIELTNLILDSRVAKIYQINHKTLLLKLRNPKGESMQLLIEAGKRVHLTSYEIERPRSPPSFCMALRKHLENGIIKGVSQYDFERMLEIVIRRGDQDYRLIVELFDEGNIILVGPEGKIMHALTYRRMRDRDILRGEEFKYPPKRGEDPRSISLEDLGKMRDLGKIEVVRGLTRLLGIGGFYAEEVLARSGVDKNKMSFMLSSEELSSILESIRSLVFQVESGNYMPCIFVDKDGRWVDVAPFMLKKYEGLHVIRFETFNRALDEYYAKMSVVSGVKEAEEAARRKIISLERVLREQEENLRELKAKADLYQRIGDLIFSHLHEIDSLIARIMSEKRGGRDWDEIAKTLIAEKHSSITPSIYFVSIDPKTLSLKVSVDEEIFDLNLKMNAQQNAAEYYARAKKARDKIEGVEKAIEQTRMRIESVKAEATKIIEAAPSELRIRRRREWYEKFRWFFSSEGFLVIGGRDASTNEMLIKKYMEPHDIVFHTDIPGSPFVLIKTLGKNPTEKTVAEAAQFTASYSRAWKEQFKAVDVYWVRPEQVSKASPSGQYLSKGSFMIYGTRNYLRNVPLEISIGVKRENDGIRVIGGPLSAISKQTNFYVKIIPGKEPSGKLAKEIRDRLARMVPPDEREAVLKIPLEEFQAFIPLGQGSISQD